MLPNPKQISGLRIISFAAFLVFYSLTPSLGYTATLRELYESAIDAYNKGQYDQAIDFYKEIIKESPQFAPAYIGIGLALKDKGGDIEEVLYYYKTAVDKDPTNVQAMEQLGRLYYVMGRSDKAQVIFENVLKINPQATDVEVTLGWICLIGKKINPRKAIFYFQDVVKKSPTPNAYFGLGMAYFSDNQRMKAMEVITQLNGMGQLDLAGKLEKAMRENRRIVLDQDNNVSLDESNDDQDKADSNAIKDDFAKTGDTPKGIKVRLRGKLDQI